MLYPKANEHDTAITGLSFAQELTDEVQFVFGKFNTLDLWYGLYPQTGRGVNGFMNASTVLPLGGVARTVPLAVMGAGVMKYEGKQIKSGVVVFDPKNIATTSGFDDLGDNGANIMAFNRFFTDFGGLPGSHMFGGVGATGEFTALDPSGFVIVSGEGIVAPKQNGTWSLIYVAEQTLWADCCNKDRKIGLLSQWGLSDEQTSPVRWSGNVGFQGQGISRSRPHDTMGVGYFYTGLSQEFTNLLGPVRDLHDVNGVELYYTAAVAKMLQVTTDLQIIEPADIRNDTAVVFGLRATMGI
jgi:porin